MTDLESKRQALAKLDERLAAGEIGAEEYERVRALLASGLSPEQCARLGVTPSPRPMTAAGAPIGPSGGRTRMPTLAELEIQPGTVLLDQWRIVRELGRGGFGAVFEAEDIKLERTLAVKVLEPAMAAKEELLARFRREVTLMRELAHDRIVRVFDYREDASEHLALITMEYVRGCSVAAVLALARGSKKPVPVALALAVFEQTLEALAAAHAQGVIHRDVTPGNILLAGGTAAELMSDPERDPRVKLVDFGIAGLVERTELSAKSRVLGTAAYVAPEVLDPDAEITPEADVYGAGAVAYELLTGKTPMVTGHRPVVDLRVGVSSKAGEAITNAVQPIPANRPPAKGALGALAERRAEVDRTRTQEARAESLREKLTEALARGDAAAIQKASSALREALGDKWERDRELVRGDVWLHEAKKSRQEDARSRKAEIESTKAHDTNAEGLRASLKDALDLGDEAAVRETVAALRGLLGENGKSDPRLVRSEVWLVEAKKRREEAERKKTTSEEKERREREAAERSKMDEEKKRKEREIARRARIEKLEVARKARLEKKVFLSPDEAKGSIREKRRTEEQARRIDREAAAMAQAEQREEAEKKKLEDEERRKN